MGDASRLLAFPPAISEGTGDGPNEGEGERPDEGVDEGTGDVGDRDVGDGDDDGDRVCLGGVGECSRDDLPPRESLRGRW